MDKLANTKTLRRTLLVKHPTFKGSATPSPSVGSGGASRLMKLFGNEDTVHYWWWRFLRLNSDYLKCCERGGTGKLAKLYSDFGDVRDDDFKTWWKAIDADGYQRGVRLFFETATNLPLIKTLASTDEWTEQFQREGYVLVAINLNMRSRKAVKTQFHRWLKNEPRSPNTMTKEQRRQIMANRKNPIVAGRLKKQFPRIEKMTGKRGKPSIARIAAKYPLSRQYSCPALKRMYLVYEAIENMKLKQEADKQRKTKLFKIARELKILNSDRLRPSVEKHYEGTAEEQKNRLYEQARELLSLIKTKNLSNLSRYSIDGEIELLRNSRRNVSKIPMWQVGINLNILGIKDIKNLVLDDRQKSTYTKTISKLYTRAKALIENTASGKFPVG